MYACVEAVAGEEALKAFAVADVDLVEGNLPHADDFRHAAQRLGVAVAQIVHHHGGVPRLVELYQCVGADISGPAGNQYIHIKV